MKTATPYPWWFFAMCWLSLGLAGGGVLAGLVGIVVGRM